MTRKWLVAIIDDESVVTLFRDALSKIDGLSIFAFTDPMIAFENFKNNDTENSKVASSEEIEPGKNTEFKFKDRRNR